MPDLLATYKTNYDAALKGHNESQAAKVKATKHKRTTFFASQPAFCSDEEGFLTATEDNNDNDDEDSLDDNSSLSNSTLLPQFNESHSGDDTTATSSAISTLQQDEMKFLLANGTKEQLISAYPGEKHLINHFLLSGL
eukprot:15328866-Ditylum_brightwellii.AAC.1